VSIVFCESCGKELIYFDEDAEEFVEMDYCSCGGYSLEYCSECGEKLDDEDIRTVRERHEFWGAPCSEEIIVGYHCHECGWEE
jgi:hypothetical protein